MLALGHTHRQAVLVFYLWALVVTGGAVSLAFLPWQQAVGPAAAAVLVSVVVTAWPWVRARRLRGLRSREPGLPAKTPGKESV
jgi:UDP-GlcNAc:undecaprenyl-phosphate GlcNAc-1-phosphate transferase